MNSYKLQYKGMTFKAISKTTICKVGDETLIIEAPDFIDPNIIKYAYSKGYTFEITGKFTKNNKCKLKWNKHNVTSAPKSTNVNNKRKSKIVEDKFELKYNSNVNVEMPTELKNSEINTIDIPDEEVINNITNIQPPAYYKIDKLKWKLLVRNSLRGGTTLLIGESGEGKSLAAYALRDALNRPLFYINLGNTQDAQTALIGKTHLDTNSGTYFSQSYFIKAITTPNAIVLLDEVSRASFDAMNILITILDKKQRYVRLNDSPDAPTITVAPGVSFIATANFSNKSIYKYSATVKIDAAILDRCLTLHMLPLSKEDRLELINTLYYDKITNDDELRSSIEILLNIINDITINYNSQDCKVSSISSTRTIIDMVELLMDGFNLEEVLDLSVIPLYTDETELTYVRTVIQKYKPSQLEFEKVAISAK